MGAVLDEHVPLFEGSGVEQDFEPLARGELAPAMLGVDASASTAHPGRCALFFETAENIVHGTSRLTVGEIYCPIFREARWTMVESELYQKGAAMRRRLMGDAAVERSAREIYSDPVMKKFIDVATETVFGALWTRPGLDLKTRALVCVVSDAATGREPELGLHLRMALRQGWTEEELTEVLLHLSGYVGVPIIRESMMVASKVFAEFRAEQAAEKTMTA
jgi:4-carboxymuconolactone decarboxylase